MKAARLAIAIFTTLVYEAVIIAVILWGLPELGIHIPLYGIIIICMGLLSFAVVTYKLGSRILEKKPSPGFTNMIGIEGRVVRRLSPQGFIKAQGEIWEARAENGIIDSGVDVIVVAQSGLKLIVRQKPPDGLS